MLRPSGKASFVLLGVTAFALVACGGGRRRQARGASDAPQANTAAAPPINGVLVCPGGSVPEGSGCGCPDGTLWIAEKCQPFTCPGGSTPEDEGCVCPNGSAWIKDQCQTCPGGSVPNDSGCACPGGTAWVDDMCKTVQVAQAEQPAPPPPQQQPSRRRTYSRGPSAGQIIGAVGAVAVTAAAAHAQQQAQRDIARAPSNPSQPTAPPDRRSTPTSSNTTVTYAECRGGMVRNGTACQCPQGQEWQGNQCVVQCHPTQRREGNQCVCPKDTRWNNGRCELWQECKPGQVRFGATCLDGAKKR